MCFSFHLLLILTFSFAVSKIFHRLVMSSIFMVDRLCTSLKGVMLESTVMGMTLIVHHTLLLEAIKVRADYSKPSDVSLNLSLRFYTDTDLLTKAVGMK